MLERRKEKFEIVRTRDEEDVKNGDYVFDIGGVHNKETNRFDHHQPGGAGERDGVEYSSFGLVWEKFGVEICGDPKSAAHVERKLVMPVDAFDNGLDLVLNKYKISPYYIQHFFLSMRLTWREEFDHPEVNNSAMFLKCVEIAKKILEREIVQAQDAHLAEESVVSIYNGTSDKRIIVLDKNYPYEYTLNNFPEPLFVIYPRKSDNTWGVRAVRPDPKIFKNRKNLPKSWAGLRDRELQKITGVSDAVFCHRALFLAVTESQEGAIKLAELAILEPCN
jgi:uncharacterized UPF0160 family protein